MIAGYMYVDVIRDYCKLTSKPATTSAFCKSQCAYTYYYFLVNFYGSCITYSTASGYSSKSLPGCFQHTNKNVFWNHMEKTIKSYVFTSFWIGTDSISPLLIHFNTGFAAIF